MKKKKLLFQEQIPEIINKLAQIAENSPDDIFLYYHYGTWDADLYVGGYDRDKKVEYLIETDLTWAGDTYRKTAYAKALDYIKKNEGKYISLRNLKTGDKVYYDKRKAIVGARNESGTDFCIVDTGEIRSLLEFNKDKTYFKTWKLENNQ
ncbi:MAG: hypothetical protein RR705_05740 [Lachnospiraceae bacterium]